MRTQWKAFVIVALVSFIAGVVYQEQVWTKRWEALLASERLADQLDTDPPPRDANGRQTRDPAATRPPDIEPPPRDSNGRQTQPEMPPPTVGGPAALPNPPDTPRKP